MKTLLTAFRVSNIERSRRFYAQLGFREIGSGDMGDAFRVMLNLPGDGDEVTIELISEPSIGRIEAGNGFSHIAIQVDDLDDLLATLAEAGIDTGVPQLPGGPDGPKTAFLTDPDGYRMELVQWPPGHSTGLTSVDFA
jgi:lactoylglutathione lyase